MDGWISCSPDQRSPYPDRPTGLEGAELMWTTHRYFKFLRARSSVSRLRLRTLLAVRAARVGVNRVWWACCGVSA